MEYILIGLCLILLILLFFNIRNNIQLKQQIKNQCGKLYEQELKSLNSFVEGVKEEGRKLQEQVIFLKEEKEREIAESKAEIQNSLNLYESSERERINLSIANEYTEQRTSAEQAFEDLKLQLETETAINREQYLYFLDLLNDLKEKHAAAISIFKKAEEEADEQNFYRIILTDFDKDDIIQLKSIEPQIHNREILAKLIWEVYYIKPYNELVKRVLNSQKVCGIYKITHLKNGKSYIGKSTDIGNRWKEHIKSSLGIGTIAKTNFHKILREEGIDSFTWQVVETCDKSIYTEREHYWIDFFQTQIYGYNEKG